MDTKLDGPFQRVLGYGLELSGSETFAWQYASMVLLRGLCIERARTARLRRELSEALDNLQVAQSIASRRADEAHGRREWKRDPLPWEDGYDG